jgi:NAD(P)-dependent dehydrogenase (short-subunit alcohol dehydrogenase family)
MTRVAIVTGASRGIGRAIALALARDGAAVMAVARDEARLAELAATPGACIETFRADVTDPRQCAEIVAETRSRLGAPLILVNSAGYGAHNDRPIWEQDQAGWRASMAVHLDAPFQLTRIVAADIRTAGWGRVVMISSTAGQVGGPSLAPFCASKHGVIGLMRAVANDLAPYNATCNAVLPGFVRTDGSEAYVEREAAEAGISVEAMWEQHARDYPPGRVVTAEEVAGVVAFLVSDAASGVNGEALTVALGSPW